MKFYAFIASGFFLSTSGIAVLWFYARWANYAEATELRNRSLGWIDLVVMLILVLCIPSFILLLGSLYGIIRRRIGWQIVFLLVAPFLLHAGFSLIRFPSFAQAAATTIRARSTEAALVSVAKRFVSAPPKWAATDSDDPDEMEKTAAWIRSQPALAALGLGAYAKVSKRGPTLTIRWGGPMATRWGIAISSVMGKAPQLDSGNIKTEEVFSSVFLYYIPS